MSNVVQQAPGLEGAIGILIVHLERRPTMMTGNAAIARDLRKILEEYQALEPISRAEFSQRHGALEVIRTYCEETLDDRKWIEEGPGELPPADVLDGMRTIAGEVLGFAKMGLGLEPKPAPGEVIDCGCQMGEDCPNKRYRGTDGS